MKFTYKYRMFPTKTQQSILNGQLETCRFLYNHLLEIRKNAWEKEKKSMSCYDTQNLIPKLKEQFPQLKSIYSQVLQNVNVRIDLAYQGFFSIAIVESIGSSGELIYKMSWLSVPLLIKAP